jgi:hypothetical protein
MSPSAISFRNPKSTVGLLLVAVDVTIWGS